MMLKIYLIFFVTLTTFVCAQPNFTLEEAQNLAIENNWGLKIASKRIEAAENQIFKGNAGMTPIIDWNTNFSTLFNQVNQKFIDGRNIDRFGRSLSPNTNLNLSWTLYDGRRMNAIFDRLKASGQQSNLENELAIQNTLANVMQAYYNIQRLQLSQEYLKKIIAYYQERLKITEERWQIGRGSKLDFLQSKTDYSTQMANLANAENELKLAKIRLNGIIGREANIDFKVNDYEKVSVSYQLEDLVKEIKLKNYDFNLIKKAEEINLFNQKEASSFKLPRISLNSNFGYNFTNNNAGLISLNRSLGLNTGVSATWRIFDGQVINRNIKQTKINAEIIKLQEEELNNKLTNDLNIAFYQFETDKKLLQLEQENKELAVENLDISLEKFKLGGSTILELNDAQTRYNTALTRLVNAQFNIKISELDLLKISGILVR